MTGIGTSSPEPTTDRLPPTVKGLAAVSLFNDLASEMVYPLLPAFVTTTLGGGAVMLGALDGAADFAASTVRWRSGRLADRPGWRLPLVMGGYLLAIVLRPVVALTTQAWQVIGVRVLDRVGKGLRSPARDAIIADAVAAPIRGRAFGLHRSADHLGAVVGSLLAFELLRRGFAVREVLGLSLVPGVIAALVLMIALRSARPVIEAMPVAGPALGSGPVATGPLVWLAGLAAARLPETLLLLRLQDLGASPVVIPLVWAVLHVVKSLAAYPAGVVTDRLGPIRTMALGSVGYAVALAGLAVVSAPTAATGVFLAYGLASGLLEPAERAAVATVAPTGRGRAYGTYQGLAGFGSLGAGLVYGWLYQSRGGSTALATGAAAGVAVLLGWLMITRIGIRRPVA